VMADIRRVQNMPMEELMTEAKNMGAPHDLVLEVKKLGKLPVPNFAAGGIATPADAALMLQLGAEAIFVGSGIFKSDNPPLRAKAIVEAAAHYEDPDLIARVSEGIGEAMAGLDICKIPEEELLAKRGW
jgi:pyridoxal 5'-phosphate synthase pdxS subunit